MPGRGGAGNIIQAQEQSRRLAQDVEANRPLASSAAPPATSAPAAEYAHMGRGGAGNWFQPAELEKEGTFSAPDDATAAPTSATPQVSMPWHPESQEMPVARAGRGGAGNFVWRDEERERTRREEEQRAKEALNEKVERDVEAGLAKPGAAMLGGVKAGRGW